MQVPAYVGLRVIVADDLQSAFPGARPFIWRGCLPAIHLASPPRQSRVTEMHVKPDGRESIDSRLRPDGRTGGIAEDREDVHFGATLRAARSESRSSHPFALTEDALRAHQQHKDEHEKRPGVLQFH